MSSVWCCSKAGNKSWKLFHIVLTYGFGSRNNSNVFIVVTLVLMQVSNLEVHINHDVALPFVHCYIMLLS